MVTHTESHLNKLKSKCAWDIYSLAVSAAGLMRIFKTIHCEMLNDNAQAFLKPFRIG